VQRRRGGARSLPGWVGGAGRVAVAELTLIAARKRRPPGGTVRCPVFVVVWLRESECSLRRSSPCPVSACSGVRVSGVRVLRCPGVQWRVCRCPVCGCPVSARLVSASDPVCARVGSWNVGAAGQRLAVGTGQLRRGRPPCPRAARLSAQAGCVAAGGGRAGGESAAEVAGVLGRLRRRLRPGSTAWPSRTAGLRAWVARQVVGDHGRERGCARGSPIWVRLPRVVVGVVGAGSLALRPS